MLLVCGAFLGLFLFNDDVERELLSLLIGRDDKDESEVETFIDDADER